MNVIPLEKTKCQEEAEVMPLGKQTIDEREGRSDLGPSKKKGKEKEGEDVNIKKKRALQRYFQVSDFPFGVGPSSYSLREDLVGRKSDVTFGHLMEMVPKMKRQWKSMVNPSEKEPKGPREVW